MKHIATQLSHVMMNSQLLQWEKDTVVQLIECFTYGQEVIDSIPALAICTLLVGSVSVQYD